MRQMADRLIALHCFHGMFVHGVVKLSFSNKFSQIDGFHTVHLDKHDIYAQLMRK